LEKLNYPGIMSNSAIPNISTRILTGRKPLSVAAAATLRLVENLKWAHVANPDRVQSGYKSRSRFVDILRGIAIIGVMFHHFFNLSIMGRLSNIDYRPFGVNALALNNGWLGVNLFFVLSGLVLYRPEIIVSKSAVKKYYISRIRRLWPLYFILIFFITTVTIKDWWSLIFYEVFLLSGLHDLWPYSWMPIPVLWVLWSLGVEILFSIALPAILIAMARYGFWRTLLVIMLSAFIYRCFADQLYWALTATPKTSDPRLNPLKDNIFGRVDDFVIGMAAAKLISKRLVFSPFVPIIGILCLAIVGASWANLSLLGQRTVLLSIFASTLHPLFSVSTLVLIVNFSRLESWNSAIFSPVAFFGTTCYSAYLVHAILQKYCGFAASGAYIADVWHFLEYFFLTFCVSAFLFVFVEASGIRKLPDWAARVLGRGPLQSP
jgi:peptidoglycan/LPS O-acetylase OafA/YrhL